MRTFIPEKRQSAGVNINRVRMGDSSGGRDREIRDRDWERERERLLMSDSKEGHRYKHYARKNAGHSFPECDFEGLK